MSQTEGQRIDRLEHAVFGVNGDDGMLQEIRELRHTLQRMNATLTAAAISFAFSAIGIVVTLLSTQ